MILQFRSRLITCLTMVALSLMLLQTPIAMAEELPKLGDAASAVVSPEQEYKIGRAWLRQLRAQAPIIQDPMINDYLFNLVYKLASYSDITNPRLETVVLDSSEINAFAVPGGIIGLNGGLLLAAHSEDELAAVIAHELAHLSQRHFARGVERSRNTSWAGLAALLASVVLAATAGGEAGMAALATTQAASIESQLRFSRANEEEADRIGMQTLERSGMNPEAMADFFETLERQSRFSGNSTPEFLLTHPVTESRITDARIRAAKMPPEHSTNSLEFSLMKARTTVLFAQDSNAIISDLQAQVKASPKFLEPVEYGLACAYLKANKLDDALNAINSLLKLRPDRITYLATKTEILNKKGDYGDSIRLSEKALKYSPENLALSVNYANALIKDKRAEEAVQVLRDQLMLHDSWPMLWNMLAEAYGEAQDRVGVYQAKAEYYFQSGRTMSALQQLQYALPLAQSQFQVESRIKARMAQMRASTKDLKF